MEMLCKAEEVEMLKGTLAAYDKDELLAGLRQVVRMYRELRASLYPEEVELHRASEERVMKYFDSIS